MFVGRSGDRMHGNMGCYIDRTHGYPGRRGTGQTLVPSHVIMKFIWSSQWFEFALGMCGVLLSRGVVVILRGTSPVDRYIHVSFLTLDLTAPHSNALIL